jgi:hypothetical protein
MAQSRIEKLAEAAGDKPPVTSFSASEALFAKAIAAKEADKNKAAEVGTTAAVGGAENTEEVAKSASDPTETSNNDQTASAAPSHSKDAPAEPWVPKTAQHWKQREKAFKERESALQHEINTLKAATGNSDITKLKQEVETLRSALRAVDAEKDPLFQQEWKTKQESATQRLQSVAPKHAERLASLASLPSTDERNKLISDILNDLPAWQQSQVGAALFEIGKLGDEKASLLRTAEERRQAEITRAQADAQQEKARQVAVFEEELEDWQEPLAGFDKNKLADSLSLAKAIFTEDVKEPRKKARLAVWGALGPLLIQDSLGKEAVIEELRGQLKALQAAQPAASGSSAPPAPEDASRGKRGAFGMSVAEAARKQGLLLG